MKNEALKEKFRLLLDQYAIEDSEMLPQDFYDDLAAYRDKLPELADKIACVLFAAYMKIPEMRELSVDLQKHAQRFMDNESMHRLFSVHITDETGREHWGHYEALVPAFRHAFHKAVDNGQLVEGLTQSLTLVLSSFRDQQKSRPWLEWVLEEFRNAEISFDNMRVAEIGGMGSLEPENMPLMNFFGGYKNIGGDWNGRNLGNKRITPANCKEHYGEEPYDVVISSKVLEDGSGCWTPMDDISGDVEMKIAQFIKAEAMLAASDGVIVNSVMNPSYLQEFYDKDVWQEHGAYNMGLYPDLLHQGDGSVNLHLFEMRRCDDERAIT